MIRMLFVLLGMVVSAYGLAENAAPQLYISEWYVHKLSPLENLRVTTSGKEVAVDPGVITVSVGDLSVETALARISVAGREIQTSGRVDCLMSPKLSFEAGQPGFVEIGRQFQYMERLPSGEFRLKLWPEPMTTRLGLDVMTAPGEESVRCKLDLKIQFFEGRVKLPGVDLDVGVPNIVTRRVNTILSCRDNAVIHGLLREKDELLVIVMSFRGIAGEAASKLGDLPPLLKRKSDAKDMKALSTESVAPSRVRLEGALEYKVEDKNDSDK